MGTYDDQQRSLGSRAAEEGLGVKDETGRRGKRSRVVGDCKTNSRARSALGKGELKGRGDLPNLTCAALSACKDLPHAFMPFNRGQLTHFAEKEKYEHIQKISLTERM